MTDSSTEYSQLTGKLGIDHLIEKSKAATSETIDNNLSNTTLSRQQADQFIDLVVDTSVLLRQIRTTRTCAGISFERLCIVWSWRSKRKNDRGNKTLTEKVGILAFYLL